ncbi:MAG: hypothetical protein L7T81_04245 [Candidatus Poseidoniaceae archaeon]|nr:hypothetical protein [Candidatus Poseidoniaceae archaeon]
MVSNSKDQSSIEDKHNSRMVKMTKKKLLLRIDPALHDTLRKWADDEFRSINAQIEFLLQKAVAENRRDSNDA